jgi:hypothetical protein
VNIKIEHALTATPMETKIAKICTVIFNFEKDTSNLVYSTQILKIRTNSINIKEIGKGIGTRLYTIFTIAPKKILLKYNLLLFKQMNSFLKSVYRHKYMLVKFLFY